MNNEWSIFIPGEPVARAEKVGRIGAFVVGISIGLLYGFALCKSPQPTKTYQLQSTNTIMVKFRASEIVADYTPACAPGWKIVRVSR